MRRIRVLFVLVPLVLAFAACVPTTTPTTTTFDVLPPPDPIGPTTPTTDPPSPPMTLEPERFQYLGSLPDGTTFWVIAPSHREELLMLASGVFNVRTEGGPEPVGEVRYTRVLDPSGLGYTEGILRLFDDPWLVEVIFDPVVLRELSEWNKADFERSIELELRRGFPVLVIEEPFTWEGADPQLRYTSFVVATGCWPEAARCSDNHAVQVISANDIFVGGAGLSDFQIGWMTLSTTSSRPKLDPNYLDPGPLTPRNSASVIWTGGEMIVWGGKEDRDGVPYLIDGAAFDPETDEWRAIARFPRLGSFGARAIWGDGEMLVVSSEGTLAYDPGQDTWRDIGQGLIPVEWNDRMAYVDGHLYQWDRAFSLHRMDLDVGVWEEIPAPDEIAGFTEAEAGVLRVVGDQLIAVTLSGACQGKEFWVLAEEGWAPLPDTSLATAEVSDCSSANQTASLEEDMVIWNADYTRAMSYSLTTNAWQEVFPIPLDGTEGASGPVIMGPDQFMVPQYGSGAIFNSQTEEWIEIMLPGHGTDAEIIWTGEEFLAWGIYDSFDAWRFTPQSGFAGGDNTS